MKGDKIKYSKGYKYFLREDYIINLPVFPKEVIQCEFFSLSTKGELRIYRRYAWDGASGPTIDTKSTMRGALVHDVGYQAIRLGLLPVWYREVFDKLLHDICREDGMAWFRADLWWKTVEVFGASAAEPRSEPKIYTAP